MEWFSESKLLRGTTTVVCTVIVLVVGTRPVSATHEGQQTCYGENADSQGHGHDGNQAVTDYSSHTLVAIMAGGRDTVLARDLDDKLCGQADPDELRGQSDSDRMNGGQGADDLFGAGGGDVLNGGDGQNDYCNGGPGTDVGIDCETEVSIP